MTTKLTHTPKPWELTENYPEAQYEIYNNDKHIASVMSESDGRLISAAPEMLEALIEIFDVNIKFTVEQQRDKMITIIEKATGKKIQEVI